MKAFIHGITVLFVLTLCQSCSVYYNAREQSAYIPNVVNQNLTLKKYDQSHVLCLGFNHAELQSNFRFSNNWTAQNNIYLSKGFNLFELGGAYRTHIYNSLYFDVAPGLSYGDMNYTRKRSYTDGTGGSSYDNYYTKRENINYHYYRGYVNQSFVFLINQSTKIFIGTRLSYTRFQDFDYKFKDVKSGPAPDELRANLSYQNNYINRIGIEPQVSVHIPYKKVGLFFQTVYYGPLWYGVNANTYNVMDQAALPLLMSIGFTFNPGSGKNK